MTTSSSAWVPSVLIVAAICSLAACAGPVETDRDARPNVLWVVWDTVRADHLSVYGYPEPTTPKLEKWAKQARVFDHCTSTAGQTLPSTASMFTGLFPAEHGTHPAWPRLDDRFTTIAERFRDSGYRTYLFSANAYLSREHNFHRGFQVEEHPWDEAYEDEALAIVQAKLEPENLTGRLARVRAGSPRKGDLKSAGALARRGLESWLGHSDSDRPFFAFLNYMEAHRPCIPPRAYRERMLGPEQVEASYRVDAKPWDYTFGLVDYPEEVMELINGVYDAAIAELDDRFAELLAGLEASGHLENTVVVLTADHGEHMGDHHMLEHQFSVYEGLIRVPLIIRYPKAFAPGRDSRPVSGIDLFPTLLELAGIEPPPDTSGRGVSLLTPETDRVRYATYPVVHGSVEHTAGRHHDWDPGPWRRLLRAIYRGDLKYIEADDGHRELYRLSSDPAESANLVADEPEAAQAMSKRLRDLVESMNRWEPEGPTPEVSTEQHERLKALGYVE